MKREKSKNRKYKDECVEITKNRGCNNKEKIRTIVKEKQ